MGSHAHRVGGRPTLAEELAQSGTYSEARPLNLDPGLLQLGKFLLAATKDQAHRIYLRDGIYIRRSHPPLPGWGLRSLAVDLRGLP